MTEPERAPDAMSSDLRLHEQASATRRPRFTRGEGLRVRPASPILRPLADATGPASVTRRDAIFRRSLGVADIAAVALSIAIVVYGSGGDLAPLGLLTLPFIAFLSKLSGLYDRDENVLHKSTLDEVPKLFQLTTLYTLVFWVLEPALIAEPLGRGVMVGLWALLLVLSIAGRTIARALAARVTAVERCLFLGTNEDFRWLSGKLESNDGLAARIVGQIRLDKTTSFGDLTPETVGEIVSNLGAERVIIATRSESEGDALVNLVSVIKGLGIKVSLVQRMFEVVGSSVEFDDLDGIPVLGVRRFGLSRSSRRVKRGLDVTGSLILVVLTAPLSVLIALLVKRDSPGPVFFRQTRVGRDGTPFEMLKFRSMHEHADEQKASLRHLNETEGIFKITDDPRITRLGRRLRKTSLDELPQLVNVLKGEMSLVGPRPLVDEDDRQVVGRHRRRLHLTPGMTGHWQVLGSSKIPLQEMVVIDYLYVANWSLWLDVKILLRTIGHVLGARGK